MNPRTMSSLAKQTKDAGSAVCSAHKRPRTRGYAAPGSSWCLDHVAGGAAGRDHRVAVLLLGNANVEQDRAVVLQRRRHLLLEVGAVVAAHAFGAEGLGQLHPVGAGAHLDRAVAAGPQKPPPPAGQAPQSGVFWGEISPGGPPPHSSPP